METLKKFEKEMLDIKHLAAEMKSALQKCYWKFFGEEERKQVRNSDLHKEWKHIGERITEGKIKFFIFLILNGSNG